MAGFNLGDWPQFDAADQMHVDDGMIKHVIKNLKANLSNEALVLVDAALKAVQPFAGLHRPRMGLSGSLALATCTKTIDVLKLLPIALLAAHGVDNGIATYVVMLQGEKDSYHSQIPLTRRRMVPSSGTTFNHSGDVIVVAPPAYCAVILSSTSSISLLFCLQPSTSSGSCVTLSPTPWPT